MGFEKIALFAMIPAIVTICNQAQIPCPKTKCPAYCFRTVTNNDPTVHIADKCNCKIFWKCDAGQPKMMECPSNQPWMQNTNQLYWNDTASTCGYSNQTCLSTINQAECDSLKLPGAVCDTLVKNVVDC